jgi:hypothetical protein
MLEVLVVEEPAVQAVITHHLWQVEQAALA